MFVKAYSDRREHGGINGLTACVLTEELEKTIGRLNPDDVKIRKLNNSIN